METTPAKCDGYDPKYYVPQHRVVVTTSHQDGLIHQQVDVMGVGGIAESVYRQMINTQEAVIRQALIEMGWTPPCDEPPKPLPVRHAGQREQTIAAMRECIRAGETEEALEDMMHYLRSVFREEL